VSQPPGFRLRGNNGSKFIDPARLNWIYRVSDNDVVHPKAQRAVTLLVLHEP
jgi:hypothetical protein